MAAGAVSSVRDTQDDVRWKWLLLVLCALCAIFVVADFVDIFGIGSRPWGGWWDVEASLTDRPFVTELLQPEPGGAAARAGLRDGDRIDLREQDLQARVSWFFNPVATRPLTVRVQRGSGSLVANLSPSTVWEGGSQLKVTGRLLSTLPALWFLACATLIASRRWWTRDGRALALAMLSQAAGLLLASGAFDVPGAPVMLLLYALSGALLFAEAILLVALSSRYGKRVAWRGPLEGFAYAMNAAVFLLAVAVVVGLATLWFDPTPYVSAFTGSFVGVEAGACYAFDDIALLTVVLCALAAVATTVPAERPRTAWLLLPVPVTLFAYCSVGSLIAYAPSYAWTMALYVAGGFCWLLGGFVVTYAMLSRRVLDFGFVLTRTVVVGIVSLIIISAFVLLEWVLGPAVAGASHATGLIANAALALVLGVSLNYIHKRVDGFVDAALFRKRHEDERALLDFSKEAAYMTDRDALLDATLEKVRRHTDARSAVVLIDGGTSYSAVRSFGDDANVSATENDEAILALKTWHKPLDPHHYATAMQGALALPMLARGRLIGVLLLGERTGGEAYAPDEVEALSQFAHGVGAALDSLATRDGESTSAFQKAIIDGQQVLIDSLASLSDSVRALQVTTEAALRNNGGEAHLGSSSD